MVPFRPNNRRSLKELGSYSPSSSQIRVSVSAQISSNRLQSAAAGQARHFEAEDQAYLSTADVTDQTLEPESACGRGAGVAEILIDDHDLIRRPPQGHSAVPQGILAAGALGVLVDLVEGALTNV